MNLQLIKKPVTKLNIMYLVLLVALYGGFWLGFYLLTIGQALTVGIVIVFFHLCFFILHKKNTVVALTFIITTGIGLGLCISAYFLHSELIPSRFFGLVLLIFAGIKCLQSFICSIIKYKKIFIACMIALEIIAIIILLINIHFEPALIAHILFALAISIFLSLGHIGFFMRNYHKNSWRNAALGLLIGYIIIVLLIIFLITEGNSAEGLEGLAAIGDDSNREKKENKNKDTTNNETERIF